MATIQKFAHGMKSERNSSFSGPYCEIFWAKIGLLIFICCLMFFKVFLFVSMFAHVLLCFPMCC